MKGPSLQMTTVVSAALHATVFLLAMIVLRNSNRMLIPSPYMVSLVSSGGGSSGAISAGSQESTATVMKQAAETKVIEKSPRDLKADQKQIEESIAALKAKEKIAKIVNLRKAVLSIKGSTDQTGAAVKTAGKGGLHGKGGQGGEMTYADRVRSEIHKQWFYPDTSEKNLEAIIAVRIMKDGQITIQEIEKKSGSRLFDKLALQAIEKASPVSPPPYDGVEFGIRFTP